MRRPAGVVVAAIVLGLMTCFGLLGTLGAVVGTLMIHNPAIPANSSHTFQAIMVAFDLISFCVLAFCAWVVVDLFRMRRWARYGIIVIGALMVLLFGIMSAGMILLVKFAPARTEATTSPVPMSFAAVFIAIGIFYAAVALVGVWWVVYFNLKLVRQAFAGAPAQADDTLQIEDGTATLRTGRGPWHGVVIAIAVLMLIGGVSGVAMGILRMPLFLLGVVLRGNAALTAALILSALSFFIGIGLLRRIRAAFWTAIVWQGLGFVTTAVFLLVPSVRASAFAYQAELVQRFAIVPGQPQPYLNYQPLFFVSSGLGLALVLVCLYALWRCRDLYTRPHDLAS